MLGAQPLSPGWRRARIRPNPGPLTRAAGAIPTPRGPIRIEWTNAAAFTLTLAVPDGMTAAVELPAPPASRGVFSDGAAVRASRVGSRWQLTDDVTGSVLEGQVNGAGPASSPLTRAGKSGFLRVTFGSQARRARRQRYLRTDARRRDIRWPRR